MLQEFKKFALRGNVMDLAIGVIIGAAFGKIVSSVVDDIIMPPIGVVLSVSPAANFEEWSLPLNAPNEDDFKQAAVSSKYAQDNHIATINYGKFGNNVVTFLIVSFSIFLVVKQINRVSPPVAKTRDCPKCFSAISVKATRCPNCTSEVVPVQT